MTVGLLSFPFFPAVPQAFSIRDSLTASAGKSVADSCPPAAAPIPMEEVMKRTVLIVLIGAAVGCAGCGSRDEAAAPGAAATSTPAVPAVDDGWVSTQIEARVLLQS